MSHDAGQIDNPGVSFQNWEQNIAGPVRVEIVGLQSHSGLHAERLGCAVLESNAGIVDQDVQTAVFGLEMVSETDDAGFIANVQLMEFRVQSQFVELFDGSFAPTFVPGSQINMTVEFAAQFFDDSKADALVRTSHLLNSTLI